MPCKVLALITAFPILMLCLMFGRQQQGPFYAHIVNMHVCGQLVGHTDLTARLKSICFKYEISLCKFVIDKRYADKTRMDLKKCYAVGDGLADRV